MSHYLKIVIIVSVTALTVVMAYLNLPAREYVTPHWVLLHLGSTQVRIVDVSLDYDEYRNEHIPWSVYLSLLDDFAVNQGSRYVKPVSRKSFEELMKELGVSRNTTLVFYDNSENKLAVRALWAVRYYGHDKALVMDGGLSAWKSAGFPVTDIPPSPALSRSWLCHLVSEGAVL